MSRNSILLTCLLLIIVMCPPFVHGAGLQKGVSTDDYDYQRVLYSYMSGDYLATSSLAGSLLQTHEEKKDELNLLQRLSDIQIMTYGEYPEFSTHSARIDRLLQEKLFLSLHESGKLEKALSLSRELEGNPVSNYYRGSTLNSMGMLKEARGFFDKVPQGERLYPYARIALAQVAVMEKDLKKAEGYLRSISSIPATRREGLEGRVHMMLGQIIFEQGFFFDALKEFMLIPSTDPLYGEACVAKAWSFIYLRDFKNALDAIKAQELGPPYDPWERDALRIMGYIYFQQGLFPETRNHYQTLIGALEGMDSILGKMAGDASSADRYLVLLLKEASVVDGYEEYYLKRLRNDPTVRTLLKERAALTILKNGFVRKVSEIREKEVGATNRMRALDEEMAALKTETEKTKKVLSTIRMTMSETANKSLYYRGFEKNDILYFATSASKYWEERLRREISDETKGLVTYIMLDWVDRGMPRCRDPKFVCHVIDFFKHKAKMTDISDTELNEFVDSLDLIASDIYAGKPGRQSRLDKMLLEKEKAILVRKERDIEVIKRLAPLREEASLGLEDTERGLASNRDDLHRIIMDIFGKERLEFSDFKAEIFSTMERQDKARR